MSRLFQKPIQNGITQYKVQPVTQTNIDMPPVLLQSTFKDRLLYIG